MINTLKNDYPYSFLESRNLISFPIPEGYRLKQDVKVKDIDTLYFPKEISDDVGLSINEITYLKQKGCPFYGRKTTIRWVRHFLAMSVGLIDSVHSSYLQDSISNRYLEPTKNYDSQAV
jgi:hypothetical protein